MSSVPTPEEVNSGAFEKEFPLTAKAFDSRPDCADAKVLHMNPPKYPMLAKYPTLASLKNATPAEARRWHEEYGREKDGADALEAEIPQLAEQATFIAKAANLKSDHIDDEDLLEVYPRRNRLRGNIDEQIMQLQKDEVEFARADAHVLRFLAKGLRAQLQAADHWRMYNELSRENDALRQELKEMTPTIAKAVIDAAWPAMQEYIRDAIDARTGKKFDAQREAIGLLVDQKLMSVEMKLLAMAPQQQMVQELFEEKRHRDMLAKYPDALIARSTSAT